MALIGMADQEAADEEEDRYAREEIQHNVQRPAAGRRVELINRMRERHLEGSREADQVEVVGLGQSGTAGFRGRAGIMRPFCTAQDLRARPSDLPEHRGVPKSAQPLGTLGLARCPAEPSIAATAALRHTSAIEQQEPPGRRSGRSRGGCPDGVAFAIIGRNGCGRTQSQARAHASSLMTAAGTAALATTTLDEDAWDDLLSYIEERRVIPIVGPELLMVETERGPRLLFDWAAERLATRLNVNTVDLPKPYTLNDVVCLFLAGRGRREEAYVRLRGIIKDASFAPPPALRHLAAISDFDLFVSTTADSLLETAVNMERFGGAQSTDVLSYSPNRVVDLPGERDQLQRPLVYHLFGKMAASPTYVISDEDLLEFICALQSEHLVPEKLFHELEHNHLLFI